MHISKNIGPLLRVYDYNSLTYKLHTIEKVCKKEAFFYFLFKKITHILFTELEYEFLQKKKKE